MIFKTFSKTKAVSALYFAKCNSTQVTGRRPRTTVREISIKQKEAAAMCLQRQKQVYLKTCSVKRHVFPLRFLFTSKVRT